MSKKTVREILEGIKYTSKKKIANNTVKYTDNDGNTHIRLHNTNVVSFMSNGNIVLNTGGWKTVTTKDRISNNLPQGINLMQEKSIWYVVINKTGYYWDKNNPRYVFKDGITIKNGWQVKKFKIVNHGGKVKNLEKLLKSINAYVKDYTNNFMAGKIKAPSSGDCWFCCMSTENGDSLGDATKDNDHLLSHMKEKYYVPSLLVNAIENISIAIVPKQLIFDTLYNQNFEHLNNGFSSLMKRDVTRALKRYLKRRLNLAG